MLKQRAFGEWLAHRRKTLDLTQKELARRVGYSTATIRKIEAEERRPSAQIAVKLAEILEIPPLERAKFLLFARGDWHSAPVETVVEAPWRDAPTLARRSLPASVTSLVGREKEIEAVCAHLRDAKIRLLSIIGPPGIGKTRLALEAARMLEAGFHGGAFFITLEFIDNPAQLPCAVFQALGLVEDAHTPLETRLIETLAERQVLLVLDNCEHVIHAAAGFASSLLTACPGVKILATSREALRCPGEWVYAIPALSLPGKNPAEEPSAGPTPPAVKLFEERARAVHSEFKITSGNYQAVASICSRLDGLPLAIEIIAARMRVMAPQALLEQLTDALVLSANGMRAVSGRQKTLNQAIGWSYSQLSADEQKLFACLSVFSGGFSLKAADAALGCLFEHQSIAELVISLSDKSLLQRSFDGHGEARFNFLVTIRQYAQNALREMSLEREARNCHLAYFLAFMEQAEQAIRGPLQAEWIDRIDLEQENIHSALDWAASDRQAGPALRMLCALGWPWEIRNYLNEARAWFERARTLPGVERFQAVYGRLLGHIGRQSWLRGEYAEAHAFLEESKAIFTALGKEGERDLGFVLNWLGLLAQFADGDPDTAGALFRQALRIFEKLNEIEGIALSTFHLGFNEPNDDLALSTLERSLGLFQQTGDQFFIARSSSFIGSIYFRRRSYDQARLYFEQALSTDRQLKHWDGIVEGWNSLGRIHLAQGEHGEAGECFSTSLAIGEEHGIFPFETYFLAGLLALHRKDYPDARNRFLSLLKRAHQPQISPHLGEILTALAATAAGAGRPMLALQVAGAVAAHFASAGGRFTSESENTLLAAFLNEARLELGEAVSRDVQAEGCRMTLEQAAALAMQ